MADQSTRSRTEPEMAASEVATEQQIVSAGAIESVVGSILDGPLGDLLSQEEIDALAVDVAETLTDEFTVTRTVRRG